MAVKLLKEDSDIINVGKIQLPTDTSKYSDTTSYADIQKDTRDTIKRDQLKKGELTLKDYAYTFGDGYMDEDVCDTEVDMLVAYIWDEDMAKSSDPYDKFQDLLASKVKVVGKGAYGPICDFSGFARPYGKKISKFMNDWYYQEYFEFDFDDEPEYAFVEQLENLISGNATGSEYRGWLEVFK